MECVSRRIPFVLRASYEEMSGDGPVALTFGSRPNCNCNFGKAPRQQVRIHKLKIGLDSENDFLVCLFLNCIQFIQ